MSIADRITSMSNNLSNAYDGIEYLGVDTTGVDKNMQNLSSMLNVVYEGLPKVSDEGISPSIDGSKVGRLNSTLKASDTTQPTTTGVNKLPNVTTQTLNGITITNNKDGSYTLNGTASTNTYFDFFAGTFDSTAFNGYYLKEYNWENIQSLIGVSTSAPLSYRISSSNRQNIQSLGSSTTNGYIQLTDNGSNLYLAVRIQNGGTLNNVIIKPMIVLNLDTELEPYTGGIPSPSPDFPQNIHVGKGNNTVEVCGENLAQSQYVNSATTQYTSVLYIETNLEPSTTYTISFKGTNGNELYTNQEIITGYNSLTVNNDITTLTFTTKDVLDKTSSSQYVANRGWLIFKNRIVQSSANVFDELMFQKGSTATTYKPYTGTTYPINLPVQNLFDKDNANILDSVYVGTNSLGISSGAKTLYISCLPNATYTISKISSQRFIVAETQTTPARNIEISNRIADLTGTNITITTSADAKYLVVFYYLSSADTLTEQQIRDSIQIEPGNKANRYTPHGVVPIELCKTNTYQDKLFKAISGDTVYDTLTAEQKEGLVSGGWYKYEAVGKLVLDGTSEDNLGSWRKSTTTDMDRFIFDLTKRKFYVEQYRNSLCNRFITIASSTEYAIGNWRNNAKYQHIFNFAEYNTTTLEQWKTWLSTHNVILYQPLITPTITQITDSTLVSQLEALYSAMSKNGQTNVLQTNADLPFIISASALKAS